MFEEGLSFSCSTHGAYRHSFSYMQTSTKLLATRAVHGLLAERRPPCIIHVYKMRVFAGQNLSAACIRYCAGPVKALFICSILAARFPALQGVRRCLQLPSGMNLVAVRS